MQCLHRTRLFSASRPTQPEMGWRKDTARRAEPHRPKGHSTPRDSMLGTWRGGRKRKWGIFGVMALVFRVAIICNGVLVGWRGINTCLPMGSSKLIPWFSLLVCMSCFTFLFTFLLYVLHYLYLYPQFFFFTLIFSLIPPESEEERGEVGRAEWASGCLELSYWC